METTAPISLGVQCPKPGCGGFLTEKRSRRGKVFYGCANYSKTQCDFVSWDKPVPKACPTCGAAFLVEKVSKAGTRLRCISEGCGYTDSDDLASRLDCDSKTPQWGLHGKPPAYIRPGGSPIQRRLQRFSI